MLDRPEIASLLDAPNFSDPAFLARVRDYTARRRRPVFEGVPVILVACGGPPARAFVQYALDHFNVVGLIDNSRRGQAVGAVPFGGDDDLHALMTRYPDAVGITCTLSENGIAHFNAIWGGHARPLLSWFEIAHELSATMDVSDLLKIHHTFSMAEFSDPKRLARIYETLKDRLDDAESLEVLKAILLYRLTWVYLTGIVRPMADIYFDVPLCPLQDDEVFLDGGAFDGDTIRSLMAVSSGRFKRVHAFEIDPVNLGALRDNVAGQDNIVVHGVGLWNEADSIGFDVRGDMGSSLNAESEIRVPVDALDDLGLEPMTFVKLDIEGAEVQALQGMRKMIAAHKPKLAICAYHRPDDLVDIVEHIRAIRPDYRFALRHYTSMVWETVIYAA